MNDALVEFLIAEGESGKLEFKEDDVPIDEIAKTVCAFANSYGGTVLMGVKKNGQITGVSKHAEKIIELRQQLSSKLSPVVSVTINMSTAKGKKILVADVPVCEDRPYAFANRIYVRKDSKTEEAGGDDIRSFIVERYSVMGRWERQPALGCELEALDQVEIIKTATASTEKNIYKYRNPTDPAAVLEDLGLSKEGSLRNSAIVLFGERPEQIYPQIRVRAVRFQDAEGNRIADNRIIEGHAFRILEQTQSFFRAHVPIESEKPRTGLKRVERPAYPFPAIREAVINAIIHRDYASYGGGVTAILYQDRIEIWNTGCLPVGMTVEDLKKTHPSRPHNPDLAHVFLLNGFIERLGTGTRHILQQCIEAGLPEPEWDTDDNGVRITLRLYPPRKEAEDRQELSERQRELLMHLNTGEQITFGEYFQSVKEIVKERQARSDLNRLVQAGFLIKKGKARATKYERSDKNLPQSGKIRQK